MHSIAGKIYPSAKVVNVQLVRGLGFLGSPNQDASERCRPTAFTTSDKFLDIPREALGVAVSSRKFMLLWFQE